MPTDIELLRRYADLGSEDAFAELVRRHVDLVYAAALRHLGNRHRAEEIVQSVFIDLARKAPLLTARSSIAGWLYVSTCHAARRLVRTEVRRSARERIAQFMLEPSSAAAPEGDRAGLFVDDILSKLPEGDRTAIVLRFLKQHSFEQVGTALGVSADTARKRVERALDRIRVQLAQRGVASSAGALASVLSAQVAVAGPPGLAASVTAAAIGQSAASAAGGLLQLSMMHPVIASVIALALTTAGGTVFFARAQAHRAGAELATVQSAVRTAALERDHLREELAHGPSRANGLSAVGGPSAASTPSSVEGAPPESESPAKRGRKLSASHPEVAHAALDYAKAKAAALVRNFEQRAALTPSQSAQLEALVAAGSSWQWDVNGKIYRLSAGGGGAVPAELEAEVSQVLGPSGSADLQRYEQTFQTRTLAGEIAAAANSIGASLTPAQALQLETILAGSTSDGSGQESAVADLDWNAARAAAAGLLNPAQLQAFDAARLQVEFNLALSGAARP